jgi:translation initiation factor IF-1
MKSNKKRSSNRRRSKTAIIQDDKIYFDGIVIETFPGTMFGVQVQRKNDLPPLFIKSGLKTLLKVKKVLIIKGDLVRVEIDPTSLTSDTTILTGTIVERINIKV